MASFDKLVKDLLEAEGGAELTDNPRDRGGLTKYGISQKAYPNLDIAALTEQEAIDIYKKDYWDKFKLGTLPEEYRRDIFFNVVNSGSSAIRDIQRALGASVDGKVGPETRKALEGFNGNLTNMIKKGQIERYVDIAANSPDQQKEFMNGWINRALGKEVFSGAGDDLRNIPIEEVRKKAMAALDASDIEDLSTPAVPEESPSSFDPLGFAENLTLLMEELRKGSPRGSQEPTEGVSEPEEEEEVQQSPQDAITSALSEAIRARKARGEKKLKRTANEAALESKAESDEPPSLSNILRSSPKAMEVIASRRYDRPINKPAPEEEPVRRDDATKDPIYGIF